MASPAAVAKAGPEPFLRSPHSQLNARVPEQHLASASILTLKQQMDGIAEAATLEGV
jgi:hypothetical protein